MEKQIQTKRQLPNKFIYTAFLIIAIIFVCIKDYSTAIIFAGIGLAFDPFDQTVTFSKRPVWQRVWLIIHCAFVFVVIWLSVKHLFH
jgi:uncharacterized membrane protein